MCKKLNPKNGNVGHFGKDIKNKTLATAMTRIENYVYSDHVSYQSLWSIYLIYLKS